MQQPLVRTGKLKYIKMLLWGLDMLKEKREKKRRNGHTQLSEVEGQKMFDREFSGILKHSCPKWGGAHPCEK